MNNEHNQPRKKIYALGFRCLASLPMFKVSKGAKIRNRCNQVPHMDLDTNRKVTNSQLDITNESQEVSPFPAGDHKAQINRRIQRHSKHKTEKNIKDTQKNYRLGTVSKIFYWRALTGLTVHQPQPEFRCGSRHIDFWSASSVSK